MSAKRNTELGTVAVILYWTAVIFGTAGWMIFTSQVAVAHRFTAGNPLFLLVTMAAIPATMRLFDHYRTQYRTWRNPK